MMQGDEGRAKAFTTSSVSRFLFFLSSTPTSSDRPDDDGDDRRGHDNDGGYQQTGGKAASEERALAGIDGFYEEPTPLSLDLNGLELDVDAAGLACLAGDSSAADLNLDSFASDGDDRPTADISSKVKYRIDRERRDERFGAEDDSSTLRL